MVYLVIQGKLRDGEEETYTRYLQAVAPLMKEYGIEVCLVGSGLTNEFTTHVHARNAILKMADQATLEKFLGDPRYLEIKRKFRDVAYEYLNLSAFEARPPRTFD
jgi:uncharacterized protein (DUF1330 family)